MSRSQYMSKAYMLRDQAGATLTVSETPARDCVVLTVQAAGGGAAVSISLEAEAWKALTGLGWELEVTSVMEAVAR